MRAVCAALAPVVLIGLGYFGADPAASTFAQFKQRLFGMSSNHVRVRAGAAQTLVSLPLEIGPLFKTGAKGPRADRYLDIKTTQEVERQPQVMLASFSPDDVEVTGAVSPRREVDSVNRASKNELLLTPITFGHASAALFLNVLRHNVEDTAEEEAEARRQRELAALKPRGSESLTYQGETEAEFQERQRRCLATAIYFEARGEPNQGQLAVAQVVMNRVRSPEYPDTICGVVFQGQWQRKGCQFSFACDGHADVPRDQEKWSQAQDFARKVTNGEIFLDDIGHATHYHATYVKPRWIRDMNRIERIGQHIFYRQRREKPYVVEDSTPAPSGSPAQGLAFSGSG